jgi:hypothetical protein
MLVVSDVRTDCEMSYCAFNIHGSVHRSMTQEKQPTRCILVIEFIILLFIEGSTCFERHATRHQEL